MTKDSNPSDTELRIGCYTCLNTYEAYYGVFVHAAAHVPHCASQNSRRSRFGACLLNQRPLFDLNPLVPGLSTIKSWSDLDLASHFGQSENGHTTKRFQPLGYSCAAGPGSWPNGYTSLPPKTITHKRYNYELGVYVTGEMTQAFKVGAVWLARHWAHARRTRL